MAEQDQAAQPQFLIEKIFVKDVSLEIPNAPQIFLERAQPELEFSFRNEGQAIGNDYHEVVLTATVTAKGTRVTIAAMKGVYATLRVAPADSANHPPTRSTRTTIPARMSQRVCARRRSAPRR